MHSNCYGESVSSQELIENAKLYNGKEVLFQGEVIGNVMQRGKYSWVNIHDGKNALGIFVKNEIISGIVFKGDYGHKGDIVAVEGIFHRACSMHGGDLDIHATKITKIKDGTTIRHVPHPAKIKIVLWLGLILIFSVIVMIIKR
ncbi:MAG: DNA-binding protein [Candidatus Omnitrophota bacterium]